MFQLARVRRFALITLLTGACVAGTASAATTFQDVLVQPPNLAPPQRGSLAGTLSRVAFGAGDLARGAFKLPLPIDAPGERGPLLARRRAELLGGVGAERVGRRLAGGSVDQAIPAAGRAGLRDR